jgi:hypothetical protein
MVKAIATPNASNCEFIAKPTKEKHTKDTQEEMPPTRKHLSTESLLLFSFELIELSFVCLPSFYQS